MMELYRGVIEDNNHPDKNGMCRVRIFGVHTTNNGQGEEDFNTIESSHLPWAEVMGSTEHGLNSGIGLSKVPRQGTMVWVMFDKEDEQRAIIIGTSTGVNTVDSEGAATGFVDPDGVYPIKDRLGEPDTNRLVRGDKLDQGVNGEITTNKTEIIDATNPEANQSEPDTLTHLGSYTEMSVQETPSGHIMEIDDTVGNERIRTVHKSGSYHEFRPDGSIVVKSVGAENHYIHVGNLNEHIQGAIKKYVESNIDEIVTGYIKRVVSGTLDDKISGIVTEIFEAGQTTTITGDLNIDVSNNVNITAGGSVNIEGGSSATLDSGGVTTVDGASVVIG